jgi:3-hydroxy acid dehydrogenase / malonic semialdehyde reductase
VYNARMKTILITGASSGIGKACAFRFAREDVQLVLAARNTAALEETKEACEKEGRDVIVRGVDVRDRTAVEGLFSELEKEGVHVDVLINNAGLAVGMDDIKDGDPEDWDAMIDTNIKGLLYMTRAALKGMIARDHGHIVNVGSIAGTQAYAKGAVYCATKVAVRFISDALRQEVVAYDIRVTNIQPGMVETNFSRVRFKGDEGKAGKVYEGIDALTGDDIAEAIAFAVLSAPNVQVSELTVMPVHQAGPGSVHRKG